jgi:hypothetical protein
MVQIICTSLHVGAAQTDIKEKLQILHENNWNQKLTKIGAKI